MARKLSEDYTPPVTTPGIPEAPNDGKQYARKNMSWQEVVSAGGGGGNILPWDMTPASSPVAAYPLDADEAELITLAEYQGITAKCTMLTPQNARATVTADWSTSKYYGATPAAATAVDVDFTTGKKAIGFRYTLPRMDAATSGASANIVLSSRSLGWGSILVIEAGYSSGQWESGLGPVLVDNDLLVIVVDTVEGTVSFLLNGEPLYSDYTSYPADTYFSVVIGGSEVQAADIGKTIGIELITDLSELGTLPAGTTDIYDNAAGDANLPSEAAAGSLLEVAVGGTYAGEPYSVGDVVVILTDGTTIQKLAPESGGGDIVTSVNGQTGDVVITSPVTSVNGQTGDVVITSPVTSVNGQTGDVVITSPEEVQQYANLAAFPATGAAGAIYIAVDTGKLYRWVSAGVYAELAPSSDEVQQYANLEAFPATGETAALYIAADTGLVYRWDGEAYAEVGGSAPPEIEVYGSLGAFPPTGVVGKLYIATDTGVAYTWSASGSNYVTTAVSGAVTQVDTLDGGTVVVDKTADVIVSTRLSGHVTKQLSFSSAITDDPTTDGVYSYVAYAQINTLTVGAVSGVKTAYVSGSPVTAIPGNTIVTVTKTTWFDSVYYTVAVAALGVHLQQSRSTATPNATVPVHAQTVIGAESNIDAALVPKGTGALLAAVPNNSTTGGNKRGQYAVDLQMVRTSATQVASASHSVISGGKSNVTAAGADYAVVAGGNSNSIGSAGTNATIGGGTTNQANANNATVCGGASNTSSGYGATTSGSGNTASGANAIAMGNGCVASGAFASVVLGQSSTASAITAVAIGGSVIADGNYSTALGQYSQTFGVGGAIAHSSGRVTTTGDVQTRSVTLFTQTTNATPSVLRTTTSAVSSSNILNNRNYTLQAIKGRCIARTPGSTVDYAVWEFTALLNRGANVASSALLAAVVPTLLASGGTGGTWGLSVTADTTNGGLLVTGTGEAGKTITWGCDLNALEVQDLS